MRSSEFYDMGAADFAFQLSESLRCIAVLSNFTKLYIDPAKSLLDSQLIRSHYQNQLSPENKPLPVSFNSQGYRLFERLENFYLEYHKVLKEALEYVEPSLVINVHSHDPDFKQAQNPSDVFIYHPNPEKSLLCQGFQ